MDRVSEAVDLFRSGCACSQAIAAAYGQPLGLEREQAMRIAAGFAGGMRLGEVCGAVSGAIMIIGLAGAPENCETQAGRAPIYARVRAFAQQFKERNGSVVCRDLLGCDISTPEGMKTAQEKNLFATTCVKMVQDAAEILEQTLQLPSDHP